MSFLSNLFGGKPPLDLQPTAELMDEDRYWQLVQRSLDESGDDQDRQESVLIRELEKLSPAEIVGFRLRTDKLLYETYSSHMWCAGYVMNGGCSDDMFEYFRRWVISRGREVYERAKADPDSLIDAADVSVPESIFDFESFGYVAVKAFENKTGKTLYDYIDRNDFKFGEGDYPKIDFDWQEDDPESTNRICPRLSARFAENVSGLKWQN